MPWGLAAISDLAHEYEEVQGIKVTIGHLFIRHGEKAVYIREVMSPLPWSLVAISDGS